VTNAALLVELVTEELPPKALRRLGEAFAASLAGGLRARHLAAADAKVTTYATPRRLAVGISDVRRTSPDKPFRQKLLPLSVAFDAAGKPTPALTKNRRARSADATTPKRESDGMTPVPRAPAFHC
jgi:glycyl-tRNA synthetase beta chain